MTDIEDIVKSPKDLQKPQAYVDDDLFKIMKPFVSELIFESYSSELDYKKQITKLRRKYHINPRKSQINHVYQLLLRENEIKRNIEFEKYVKAKEMRGQSGVIVISVITDPYPEYIDEKGKLKKQRFSCKHDCSYCPREVDENNKDINPRSYLSDEPTVARGLQHNFKPIAQFNDRAKQYVNNGHVVDKIEIIVLGGTWTEYPREYQEDFINKIFWAANNYYKKEKLPISTLKNEQTINSNLTKARIIGLTLEMRPDSITNDEIKWLRYLGCTRIQLGVQHTDDKILKKMNRGCYTKDTIRALKLLKDACYKVDAHWMPDLPGSTPEIDKKMFDEVLNNENLQFDQWKIYPTAVVPWTKIKKMYDKGEYIPYTEENPEKLIDVLIYTKKKVHPWIRLNRVVRDIPNKTRNGYLYIYAGNKKTNLRQILKNRLDNEKSYCSCIRCREVKNKTILISKARIIERKYLASDGIEYFISIESGNTKSSFYHNGSWYNNKMEKEKGIIYGFCRLRISQNSGNIHFPELQNCGLGRELHVYGQVLSKNELTNQVVQHKGFGKRLVSHAELISKRHGLSKIAFISGIGVQNFYKKLDYKLENTYMIKDFNNYYLKFDFIQMYNQPYHNLYYMIIFILNIVLLYTFLF